MISRVNKIEQEKSLYTKIQDSIKHAGFEIIYQLLREEEISLYTAIILLIIEFL